MSKVIDRDSKGRPIKYGVYKQTDPEPTRNVYIVIYSRKDEAMPKIWKRDTTISWASGATVRWYEPVAVDLTREQADNLRYSLVQLEE